MDAYPQIHTFSQANPLGPDEGDVPALLRRLADSIDKLGVVSVLDLTFENEVTGDGLWPSMTVYFHYGALGEPCTCGRCVDDIPRTDQIDGRVPVFGLDSGRAQISDDFDAPLPDDILRAFEE
jgi:hypothetical protein